MKPLRRVLKIILTVAIVISLISSSAGLKSGEEIKPLKHEDKKWRIGYCETEPFSNYSGIFYNTIKGLAEYGWLKNVENLPFSQGQDDTKAMWEWLATNDMGEYIEFPADAHYVLSEMKDENGKKPEDVIIDRLNTKNDIDLMIVMGTKAGTLLGNDRHKVPVFVFSASNAYKSGIVNSVDCSGNSHIWAHMDINRFKRQLQVFSDVFEYKKLGIVYENTELGKGYAALDDIESMAKERGFEIVREFVNEPKDNTDVERYHNDLKVAYSRLSQKVDAFYITVASINSKWFPDLLEPFYRNKIPVFSQLGDDEVKHGALMSISYFDFPNMGRFGADSIIKALSGMPVDKINQSFENTPQIIINLETAKRIDYRPAFDIMLAADKVYSSTEK